MDYDANGKVTYLLESEGEETFFRIDANSGVISLRSALDRELKAQHILNVIASGELQNLKMIKRSVGFDFQCNSINLAHFWQKVS